MSDANVFSGMKLSNQVSPPPVPVDQRLFLPVPSPSPAVNPPIVHSVQPPTGTLEGAPIPAARRDNTGSTKSREIGKEGNRPTSKAEVPIESARTGRPLTEPATKTVSRFDINEKPWRKDSFLFTDSEFDRLEDFKLELRRRFDLKATKNDIARAAFQQLYEDYTRDPAKSAVVRHLRSKQP
jgi:hypothetical protein